MSRVTLGLLYVIAMLTVAACQHRRGSHQFWHDVCLEAFEKGEVERWYESGDCFESISVIRCYKDGEKPEIQACVDRVKSRKAAGEARRPK